jgi:hypothetical protein
MHWQVTIITAPDVDRRDCVALGNATAPVRLRASQQTRFTAGYNDQPKARLPSIPQIAVSHFETRPFEYWSNLK